MAKRVFDVELAREIVGGENEDWEIITTPEIFDQRRWVTCYFAIFKELSTGKFYEFAWERGSTEQQDIGLYEYEDTVTATEVEKKEVVTLQWVEKND